MEDQGKYEFEKPKETVDITPTWEDLLPLYAMEVTSKAARAELMRMAKAADAFNVLVKERKVLAEKYEALLTEMERIRKALEANDPPSVRLAALMVVADIAIKNARTWDDLTKKSK